MASIGAVGGAIQHFKMMLTIDKGWTQGQALNIVSMIAAVSLIGRFGAGWLADRIGPKRVMLIVYALVTARDVDPGDRRRRATASTCTCSASAWAWAAST